MYNFMIDHLNIALKRHYIVACCDHPMEIEWSPPIPTQKLVDIETDNITHAPRKYEDWLLM